MQDGVWVIQDRICQEYLAAMVGCGGECGHGRVPNEQGTEHLAGVLLCNTESPPERMVEVRNAWWR